VTALLLLGLALAGAPEDLALATRKDLDEPARMAAFERLVDLGATDLSYVLKVSTDPNADARERWVATRVLGQVGGPRCEEALLKLLDDDMPAMRVAAASALGDLGDHAAVDPLIAALRDDALLVRGAAADALGTLGDARGVAPLAAALRDPSGYHRGSSLWVRKHYVDALGRIGDKAALPTLLSALDDPDPAVSEASQRAMEDIAGFSMSEGRDADQEREAWRRWATAQVKALK